MLGVFLAVILVEIGVFLCIGYGVIEKKIELSTAIVVAGGWGGVLAAPLYQCRKMYETASEQVSQDIKEMQVSQRRKQAEGLALKIKSSAKRDDCFEDIAHGLMYSGPGERSFSQDTEEHSDKKVIEIGRRSG